MLCDRGVCIKKGARSGGWPQAVEELLSVDVLEGDGALLHQQVPSHLPCLQTDFLRPARVHISPCSQTDAKRVPPHYPLPCYTRLK